jgi:predicted transposase/invertase (TIGR01784 family)
MCRLRKGEGSMSDETFLMKPKVDFCFKELMEDAEIRRGFISALLGVKPEKIEGTELLPTHLRREHEEDKLGILDIRVFIYDRIKGKGGFFNEKSQMDLEIQLAPFPLWPERSVFYLAKMFTGEIKKGESYDVLQKCIHVGILNFLLFPEDEEFYSRFHLWEDNRRRMYTDKLEIHILELPKLKERNYLETEILNWARFFNAEHKEEFEMAAEASPYIERAYERLTQLSGDEMKRLEYETREKAIRDHNYLMKYNLELGMKAGIEQGAKALIEICQDNSVSKESALASLIEKLSISKEEAERYLEKYWVIQH